MSLLAAGLVIAIPMAACVALAQEPAAIPTKMTTPEGYSAHHSVDVGGRVANKVGSGAMYDTMVNLQSGPRVNGESIELRKLATNKHSLVDNLSATGNGFGGEPYNFARLSASKAGIYEFSGFFRRNRQYFDYDLLGNPNLPKGISVPIGPSATPTGSLAWPQVQHSSVMTNSVRRMTDTDLVLFPQSKVSLHLSYSQNVMQGSSLLPARSGGILKYSALLAQYQRHSTDEYTVAVDWKPVQGTSVTYEQRFLNYKENSYFTLDPNGFLAQEADGTPAYLGNWDLVSNGAVNTATTFAAYSTAACNANSIINATTVLYPSSNGGKPIIDPACSVVTSYSRTNPYRTTLPSETVRFQSNSIKNLTFNGQGSYSWAKMNMPNYIENAWGLNGTARNEYYSASGTTKREVYNADFGVVWQATKDFSLADQVSLMANAQPGTLTVSPYTKLATPVTAGTETINYTGALITTVTSGSGLVTGMSSGTGLGYFGNEQLSNNLTAAWTPTPKTNFSFTYRWSNRNIGVDNPAVATVPYRTTIAITENGGIFNAAYRVTSNWDINGSIEALYDDNAFTAMSPRQVRHYRIHTKFRPEKWATFTAAFNDMERHNNTNNSGASLLYGPLNHVDQNRTVSVTGALTPSEHFAINFDYANSLVYTATNICYTAQDSGFLTGNTSPYFAGAASVSSTGAPLTCPTSATVSTPTQWLARAFMDAPSQYGSVAVVVSPNDKVKYDLGYRINSANGNQFFTDARAVNGSLNSAYQTPYASVDWTVRPGLVWKAEYNYYGYGEQGTSGATLCSMNSVATVTAANIVPCSSLSVSTGITSGNAGMTAPRTFHANNVTLGLHYEF
jgi:hypothetical protein